MFALKAFRDEKLPAVEAWKRAVMHTRKNRTRGYTQPPNSLAEVLKAYSTWSGATSSGVEQSLSVWTQLNPRQRAGHTSAIMDRNELKVTRDTPTLDNVDLDAIVRAAQKIWPEHFGAPRKGFVRASVAAGLSKMNPDSERSWFARRRASVQEARQQGMRRSFADTTEAARAASAPKWNDSLQELLWHKQVRMVCSCQMK